MGRTVSDDRLTQIYEQYSDMVYRIAFARMASKDDANDVFQEVFLKLVENLDKLSTDEHVRNWLIRVTINCCNTAFRKHKDFSDYDDEIAKDNYEDDASLTAGETSEDALMRRETQRVVQKVLRALKPPEYRDILYLFYFEQLQIDEIAAVLRITPGNARTKLSRARASIKKALIALGEG